MARIVFLLCFFMNPGRMCWFRVEGSGSEGRFYVLVSLRILCDESVRCCFQRRIADRALLVCVKNHGMEFEDVRLHVRSKIWSRCDCEISFATVNVASLREVK